MKYRVYATTNHGEGFVTSLGEYENLEDIKIRCGTFAPDVVVTIEEVKEE